MAPDIGTIEASKVKWSGLDGIKDSEPIQLTPCDTLVTQTVQPLTNEYSNARNNGLPKSFLCPDPKTQMSIRGDYYSKDFEYIKVRVIACSENCRNDEDIPLKEESLRIVLAEPSVKYGFDYTTDNALEWSLNDQIFLQIDAK